MSKVFISYSHQNEDWKKRLQTQLAVLEKNGKLSVWEDRQITAGDDWYPEIERAINEANVALLLISAEFLSSNFILREEIPRLLDRRKNDGLRIIPLILKPCPWQTIPWLSKIQGRPLDNKPLSGFNEHDTEQHLCDLTIEINNLLEKTPTHTSAEKQRLEAAKPIANFDPSNPAFLVPFREKGKYMVGREQALKKVRQQLLEGRPTSIGQTALFQGMGGLGKTQLAVEYAYRYRNDYPNGVYWITADGNIDSQLTKMAVDARWVASESEHAIKLGIALHRIKNYSDCLIIFDNLEMSDAIQDYLPEPQVNLHILVTSRSEQPNFTDIKLDLLDNDQSFAMLVQEARRQPENTENETAAREIATALGGLPLALELAGAYLDHRPSVSWCSYRDMLIDNLKQALPSQLSSLTRHDADLFKTLSISEKEIGNEPLLTQVLDLLTWSGALPMGLPLMSHLLDVKPAELHHALGLGVALRLLQQEKNSERYAIHRLVQEVRRQDKPLELRVDWVSIIAQRMGDWFEKVRDDFHELPSYELDLQHLRAWQAHAVYFTPTEATRLLWLQAYPAYHRGHYDEALRVVQQAYMAYEAKNLGTTLLKANLLNDQASCHSSLGSYPRALELDLQALDIRHELLGEKHPDIANSLSNLASVYGKNGDTLRALELTQQALNMQRELLGEKHPDIACSLSNLSGFYSQNGDTRRALEFGQQALDMRRELLGEKHPDVAISLSNLANYYSGNGDIRRALELGQQALDMRRDLLGEKHPGIANSLGNLASYYSENGETRRALELGQQALDMRRELLGEKHPDIANSLSNLAGFYSQNGDTHHALELGQQALDMRRELLGASHPSTIKSLRFVARRLLGSPFSAGKGKVLIEQHLRLIPHDHYSRANLLKLLDSHGFRKPGQGGHGKKQKKKRK